MSGFADSGNCPRSAALTTRNTGMTFRKFALFLALAALLLWVGNTSVLSPGSETRLLAHRGVHQTFDIASVGNDTCTAAIIDPPRHDYLENTIPSMRAAFQAGADVVELDVHLTPDGRFAVFHDWTLDCRTDGRGVTEETTMTDLKKLDIGYGYTADGGITFPLRGSGVGLMPTLTEVLEAFPDRKFLVNYKSGREEEGAALVTLLAGQPQLRAPVWAVYGGEQPTRAAIAGTPGLRGYDKASVKACLLRYVLLGWSGYVPAACRNTLLPLPANIAPWVWGYPHRLTARMKAAGTDVVLLGEWSGGPSSGIDDVADMNRVPRGFDGYVWTNRIEEIGPALKARN